MPVPPLKPYWTTTDNKSVRLYLGDSLRVLQRLPSNSVHCCVTSPPYWGLRSYISQEDSGKAKEIGREETPEAFVETMVQVFREIKRVLHASGTCWLNLGTTMMGGRASGRWKVKDLVMTPFLVAEALRVDGWYLRSIICWHKKSPMPESVNDRPTNSWEPIFLLAKSSKYFYDAEAVKEGTIEGTTTRSQRNVWSIGPEAYGGGHFAVFPSEIPRRAILAGTSEKGCCPKCLEPQVRIVERYNGQEGGGREESGIKVDRSFSSQRNGLAGSGSTLDGKIPSTRTTGWKYSCECSEGEPIPCTVLDPFVGSGTTCSVALIHGRHSIGIDLSKTYLRDHASKRIIADCLGRPGLSCLVPRDVINTPRGTSLLKR